MLYPFLFEKIFVMQSRRQYLNYDPFADFLDKLPNKQSMTPIRRLWIEKYFSIVRKWQQINLPEEGIANQTESHHIVPKSWGGPKKTKANRVVVPYKIHLLLHIYLSHIDHYQMAFALTRLWGAYDYQLPSNINIWKNSLQYGLKRMAAARKYGHNLIAVVDLDTRIHYRSISELAKALKVGPTSATSCIVNHRLVNQHRVCTEQDFNALYHRNYDEAIKALTKTTTINIHVVDLNSRIEYSSFVQASKAMKCSSSSISSAVRSKTKCRGHYWITSDDLEKYYGNSIEAALNDYTEQTKQKAKKDKDYRVRYKVVNVETKQTFDSIAEAGRSINCTRARIKRAIENQRYCEGYWICENDFVNQFQSDWNSCLDYCKRTYIHPVNYETKYRSSKYNNKYTSCPVYDLNENRLYDSMQSACAINNFSVATLYDGIRLRRRCGPKRHFWIRKRDLDADFDGNPAKALDFYEKIFL